MKVILQPIDGLQSIPLTRKTQQGGYDGGRMQWQQMGLCGWSAYESKTKFVLTESTLEITKERTTLLPFLILFSRYFSLFGICETTCEAILVTEFR